VDGNEAFCTKLLPPSSGKKSKASIERNCVDIGRWMMRMGPRANQQR
jgi:hypothetical protein